MPVNKKLEQGHLKADSENAELKKSVGNRSRKAQGTRFGTLIDWREGSTRVAKTSRHGDALRNGQ
jgi:hypothetical protein